MTPLLLFLLGCAVTYLGTVSAAFNALMRLSLRIHAERTDRDDSLGWYLEDPRRFFVPARMLSTTLTVLAAALAEPADKPVVARRLRLSVPASTTLRELLNSLVSSVFASIMRVAVTAMYCPSRLPVNTRSKAILPLN